LITLVEQTLWEDENWSQKLIDDIVRAPIKRCQLYLQLKNLLSMQCKILQCLLWLSSQCHCNCLQWIQCTSTIFFYLFNDILMRLLQHIEDQLWSNLVIGRHYITTIVLILNGQHRIWIFFLWQWNNIYQVLKLLVKVYNGCKFNNIFLIVVLKVVLKALKAALKLYLPLKRFMGQLN
jgi:hypothetical protein